MLSGAVNTSIIGSNGVLNRVSEDGVLSSWFRQPHRRYGTSYRIINLIVILQIGTIVASGGDTYVLGEAYAFGVLWSFVFNSLSMFVLRFKNREPREWRVPLNIRWGRKEIPLGILIVLLVLLATATVNLLTKQVATISGLAVHRGILYSVHHLRAGCETEAGRNGTRSVSADQGRDNRPRRREGARGARSGHGAGLQ